MGSFVPIAGERVSGDSCSVIRDGDRVAVALVDGRSWTICRQLRDAQSKCCSRPFAPPQDTVQRAHERLSSTRGGALAVALVDLSIQTVLCSGWKHQRFTRWRRALAILMTQNGIVGGAFRGLKKCAMQWRVRAFWSCTRTA
jgi:hypothetical protein